MRSSSSIIISPFSRCSLLRGRIGRGHCTSSHDTAILTKQGQHEMKQMSNQIRMMMSQNKSFSTNGNPKLSREGMKRKIEKKNRVSHNHSNSPKNSNSNSNSNSNNNKNNHDKKKSPFRRSRHQEKGHKTDEKLPSNNNHRYGAMTNGSTGFRQNKDATKLSNPLSSNSSDLVEWFRNRKEVQRNNNNTNGNKNTTTANKNNHYHNPMKRWSNNNNNKNNNNNNRNQTNHNYNVRQSQQGTIQQQEAGLDQLRSTFIDNIREGRKKRPNNHDSSDNLYITNNTNKDKSKSDQPETTYTTTSNRSSSRLDELLKLATVNRERARKEQQNSNNSNTSNIIHNNDSTRENNWTERFGGGAKAFRERRKAARIRAEQQQNHNHFHNNNNNDRFSKTAETYAQSGVDMNVTAQSLKRQMLQEDGDILNQQEHIHPRYRHRQRLQNNNEKNKDKTILLPNRPLSINEISNVLRIPIEKIRKTLTQSLGETPPPLGTSIDNKQQPYKVDVDVVELLALELGFDPKYSTHQTITGKVEQAEGRVLRSSLSTDSTPSSSSEMDTVMTNDDEDYASLPPRPPVVCIMGHVDHGKTTLMDALRRMAAEASNPNNIRGKKNNNKRKDKKSKKKKDNHMEGIEGVAGTEAGGITQVVSAFQVTLPNEVDDKHNSGSNSISTSADAVTFLDTPGHAAFKAMRQSGCNCADVMVLVIAADDGVSQQTVEIINTYKTIARSQPGSISLVVAMTKIDKPGIDIEESIRMVENSLASHDVYTENMGMGTEEFGGVQMFPVSGITGDGLEDLVEGLILQSEIMDLRADKDARAEGLIIDAKIEKGLGVVADCIVRWGKLEKGDYVVSGLNGGKVRILNDVNNKNIKIAGPSQPVRIIGFKTLPKSGDPVICVQSEEDAKEIISRREGLSSLDDEKDSHRADSDDSSIELQVTGMESKQASFTRRILEKYGMENNGKSDDDVIRIPVILKADADGTLAAVRDSLLSISDESKLNLAIDPIGVSVGHITTSDVRMASESGAAIFCFNLKGSGDRAVITLAKEEDVTIRSHNVIYHLLDDAKDVFSKFCPLVPVEVVHGNASVQAVFDINNKRDAEKIAGLRVNDGTLFLKKSSKESGLLECEYRIKRKGQTVSEGLKAKSLKKVKEEVESVRRGDECGLGLLNHTDIEEGDIIECFSTEFKNVFV